MLITHKTGREDKRFVCRAIVLRVVGAEGGTMTGTSMLYHYFRKFDGNVCMDWRLTNDLNTSLQTTNGKTELVNTKAFETFLNPDFKGSEPGSCQGAGQNIWSAVIAIVL